MSFKIYTIRPELQGKIDRRDLVKLGLWATGGAMVPRGLMAQADIVPTEEFPPSQNREVPETNLGGLWDQGILPDNRLLLYYGFPGEDLMGILGEYTPEEIVPIINRQREEYEAVTTDGRPWLTGFELIGSVAQRDPQPDNTYVADTGGSWLDQYTIFAHENNMQLMIDVQMGRKKPHEDYEGLERWLRYPHVHLAIDPEFHLENEEDGVPGIDLGRIHANDVTRAQNWLVALADKYGLPRKILMVHQFHLYMITEKELIQPVDGVDLVLNMDGWGTPQMKRDTYNVVITQHPIQYNGVKVFYRQDLVLEGSTLMSAADVMSLDPVPDLVNYQ